MRTLKFIVEDQILSKDPKCDFSNLVPGSSGNIIAEFSFSKKWDSFTKVVALYSPLGREYPPQVLSLDNKCVIPSEVLDKRMFKIQIIGKLGPYRLKTNRLEVLQDGGMP